MDTYLILVIAVLAAALVFVIALGRIDARAIDRLAKTNASQAEQLRYRLGRIASLQSEVELLGLACDRLTRQRDAATSLLTADLATLPTTHDREYPR